MGVYLALGDSISIDDYTGVRVGGAASQLARKLDLDLIDLTRDGNTTHGIIADLASAPASAEVVTLTAGGNDLLGGDLPNAILRRLHEIAHHMQPLGARVIVNTIYDPSDGDSDVGRRELGLSRLATIALRRRLNALHGGIVTLARERGFLLADLERLFHGHGVASNEPWRHRAEPCRRDRDRRALVRTPEQCHRMTRPETHHLPDAGGIPNSPLPVLLYHDVDAARDASPCEGLFARNGWLGAWVDGIYSFHHFHSTTHEVLGIVAGSASVILGGPSGRRFDVERGDVLVLPAGTGHCNAGSSGDLLVVGGYPNGMRWDLRRGDPAERDQVLANIEAAPLPEADPVHGPDGPLIEIWPAVG